MTADGAPIFIPSKGRHDIVMTMRYLDKMGQPYTVIVEDQEHDAYAAKLGEHRLAVLPDRMKETYDLCQLPDIDYGSTSTGSGPARNYAWELAAERGAPWHWVIDDNIAGFRILNQGTKIPAQTPLFFRWMEYFAACYSNVMMAGPHYDFFAPASQPLNNPLVINHRIYSCNLIRTAAPFEWRGQFNEDTILSIDMLKAGYCTVLFNMFLAKKVGTQTMKGGNTDELYARGTTAKSQMLYEVHPDVTTLVERWGRPHHVVNYHAFGQPLQRLPPEERPERPAPLKLIRTGKGSPRSEALFSKVAG